MLLLLGLSRTAGSPHAQDRNPPLGRNKTALMFFFRGIQAAGPGRRDREVEPRARLRFGLAPNSSAMRFHDPPADGQAETGSGSLARAKPLQRKEHCFVMLPLDPDPVIDHRKAELAPAHRSAAHMNPRRAVDVVHDGVRDQILQHLGKGDKRKR